MLFNKSNGTMLTTVWGDPQFTTHLSQLLKIPKIYANSWHMHFMSFEFLSPANQSDKVSVRIYTKQQAELRLPLVKGVGDYVTPIHEQTLTPAYVVECDGATISNLRDLLEQQLQHVKSHLTPQVLQEIQ